MNLRYFFTFLQGGGSILVVTLSVMCKSMIYIHILNLSIFQNTQMILKIVYNLYTIMTSRFFEIWQQDLGNDYISNRDMILFRSRTNNIIIPSKTISPKSNSIQIRDINIENKLFTLNQNENRDVISPNQKQKLDKEKDTSNHLLYQTYHTKEINSICFPNIDKNPWGNTTKAFYNTSDKRNKIFPPQNK